LFSVLFTPFPPRQESKQSRLHEEETARRLSLSPGSLFPFPLCVSPWTPFSFFSLLSVPENRDRMGFDKLLPPLPFPSPRIVWDLFRQRKRCIRRLVCEQFAQKSILFPFYLPNSFLHRDKGSLPPPTPLDHILASMTYSDIGVRRVLLPPPPSSKQKIVFSKNR